MTNKSLLSTGLGKVAHNKRYIFWFWLLNLTLAEFGTAVFWRSAHAILDHTLLAERLLKGFDVGIFGELLYKPEFGTLRAMTLPAFYFAFTFFSRHSPFSPGYFLRIRFELSPAPRGILPCLRAKPLAFHPHHDHRRHCDGHCCRPSLRSQ